jgi:microcystin-dependent protein
MPYIVNFTDRENKVPITVFDNTSSTDTSLVFPGRNVTGYGQIIAENFLALLENFARSTAPTNPTEGQLWYDSAEGVLKIWDNVQWKAASNIQKSPVEPAVDSARLGELWVDTTNQQLYIFSGTRWILVGPNFSTGLRSGPLVEQLDDSDGQDRIVLTFYVEDEPIFIISKDSFTPKISIPGFNIIRTGLNITSLQVDDNDLETKLWGKANTADALNISGVEIPAGSFLRSDVINTTEFGINIRNNSGINIGTDGNFSLTTSTTAAKIYNSAEGSSLDLQINRGGIPETILRVIDNKVGINVPDPNEVLEVSGNVLTDGNIIVTNSNVATNLTNGTIRTAGGVSIAKNLIVGESIDVTGSANLANTSPKITDFYDLGTASRRWNNVRTKRLVADVIEGTLDGNIVGNASTATNLRFATSFQFSGDVSAPPVTFDGQVGGLTKTFVTEISPGLISSKLFPQQLPGGAQDNPQSLASDTLLVFRSGKGLIKQTRNAFFADLAVPIGTIFPFAGANVPEGYLLCDGSELERVRYNLLFDVIGTTYNGSAALVGVGTYRLPDLRGRFALGRDNMENGITVPNNTGGYVDAGGGNIDRVPGTAADNLAGFGGQSSNTLIVGNLPDHEHNMRGSTGQQYFATRIDTAAPLDSGAFSDKGPTTVGQSQYLPSSGGVRTSGSLGQPFAVMNPYLTINYIIRSGLPAF